MSEINIANLLESLGGSSEEATKDYDLNSLGSPNKEVTEDLNKKEINTCTNLESRALKLLGKGINQESVASALGVSAGRISQLLSDSDFATKVANLRFEALQTHSERDAKCDELEDKLLIKLKASLSLMTKPDTILKAYQIVNGAKRRGLDSTSGAASATTNIVNLMLPKVITQNFVVNSNNQVVKAGDQNLFTMSSGDLLKKVEAAEQVRLASLEIEENEHVRNSRDAL